MGYCLYGNEIDDTTSPIAAGLGWVSKVPQLGIDKALLEQQKKEGTATKLVAFKLNDRGIPRTGYTIVDETGSPLGNVTSGTQCPYWNQGIGLGYVARSHAKVGQQIGIRIREKNIAATVVKLPFI